MQWYVPFWRSLTFAFIWPGSFSQFLAKPTAFLGRAIWWLTCIIRRRPNFKKPHSSSPRRCWTHPGSNFSGFTCSDLSCIANFRTRYAYLIGVSVFSCLSKIWFPPGAFCFIVPWFICFWSAPGRQLLDCCTSALTSWFPIRVPTFHGTYWGYSSWGFNFLVWLLKLLKTTCSSC